MRLDNVAKIYRPNTTSRSHMTGMDGLKCVHYGDIYKNYSGREVKSSDILNSISIDFPEQRIIKQNAIIIADVSETLDDWGHVTFIKFDGTPFINGTHTFAVVSDCDITLKYMFYYLRYDVNIKMLRRFLTGVTVFQMSIKALSSFKLELPSLADQTFIADILSAYDDSIENNNRRIALLEKAARELYREWFIRFRFPGHENVKFVNGLPEGWEVKRLGDICSLITRGITPQYVEEGVLVVNQKCVRDGEVDISLCRMTYSKTRITKEKYVRFGDILINSTGKGTLGRTALFCARFDNITVDTHVTIVRVTEYISSFYVAYFIQNIESIFDNLVHGATNQTELYTKDIRNLKLYHPSKLLLHKFAKIVEEIIVKKNLLQVISNNLARQRDLLLPRLMSGKLEVN
ncbi:MAG: restriction endonuclease subunit S [Oscillospiraceae bacterium]|nr:restriction endonuclease subunit S [Oscillospiraceae bacterium]